MSITKASSQHTEDGQRRVISLLNTEFQNIIVNNLAGLMQAMGAHQATEDTEFDMKHRFLNLTGSSN